MKPNKIKQILVILVLLLLINLPIVTASELSNAITGSEVANSSTSPALNVQIPERFGDNRIQISGTTAAGARVTLFVNDALVDFDVAETGSFSFENVFLNENEENQILIEAVDENNNKATFTGSVFSDTIEPSIQVNEIPELIEDSAFQLTATFSEQVNYELTVNNNSAVNGEGTSLQEQISLEEGKNKVIINFKDLAGLENSEELEIISDTQVPRVDAEINGGEEFYEGSAVSSITGESEAGASVYLYVYRPLANEFQPDFKQALAKTTVNDDGTFTFSEVDFEEQIISLEDLAPRQVPVELLEETSILPLDQINAQESVTYYIYIIVEDVTGKTGYWYTTITVNTCFSSNFDFVIESVPELQAPYRLLPSLLDEGRQKIQALFELDYNGEGVPEMRGEDEISPAYRVDSVHFTPACTREMEEDLATSIACKILPNRESTNLVSGDGSSVYVEWSLGSAAEVSERKSDFWDDFTERRQLTFPFKVEVRYQDRIGEDEWSETKVQTSCENIGYFVDIPLESSEMIPDFLAEEGVDALDFTIEQIGNIRPVLEEVYFYTAIGAVISFLLRTITRWIRITTSKLEAIFDGPEGCKLDQTELYLSSTIADWQEAGISNTPAPLVANDETDPAEAVLDTKCPKTAKMWKIEEALDLAYHFTGDRAFCRAVPAGWTEDKSNNEINRRILEQQQCGVTGSGIPLTRVENCQDLVETYPINVVAVRDVDVCWQGLDANGQTVLYRVDHGENLPDRGEAYREDERKGFFRLQPILALLGDLQVTSEPLLVYKAPGSEEFFVGRDTTCKQRCREADSEADFGESFTGYGCYIEQRTDETTRLYGANNKELSTGRFSVGYTKDCFIRQDPDGSVPDNFNPYAVNGETGMQQCVCLGDQELEDDVRNERNTLRTAQPNEPYSYREDRIFQEEDNKGTFYSLNRYYSGRDFTGAFGANYLPDYLREIELEAKVNPRTQLIGTFQSICLPGMLSYLQRWESILLGLRACIIEAKTDGLQDAGMCKSLFSRYMCGLIYDAVAALSNSCSPSTYDESGSSGAFGEVGVFLEAGREGLEESVDTSIDDFQREYGNAALNDYFKEGSQGFAQSICMAALGYEFPLFDRDFLMDAAYSTPMATSVVIAPKTREFSTYNPAEQRAIYNYQIGAVILPGCRIRNFKMSLVCIKPEDLGHPGVDPSCNGEGCDCLNAAGPSPLENEKELVIYPNGPALTDKRMFDVPLEVPLTVDSAYRYDHVKVEMFLDPSESGNEASCFDEGYTDGVFFEPIRDISPDITLGCTASLVTGEYECPELSERFGFGGAYLDQPYATCWNDLTETWMDCETPNLFVMGDELKLRIHMNLNGEAVCLRREPRNAPSNIRPATFSVGENLQGYNTYPENFGLVNEEMFGTNNEANIDFGNGCGALGFSSTGTVRGGSFTFEYNPDTGLIVSDGVRVEDQYSIGLNDRILKQNGQAVKDVNVINEIDFIVDGFTITNILDGVSATGGSCTVTTTRSSSSSSARADSRQLSIRYELLEKDEAGGCTWANIPVHPSQGRPSYTVNLLLQRELSVLQDNIGLHDAYLDGEYGLVSDLAVQVINQHNGNLLDAIAIYYWTASYIAQSTNDNKFEVQMNNLLKAFFDREWAGQESEPYDDETQAAGEYQKIEKYMNLIGCESGYLPEGESLQEWCRQDE